MKITIVLLMLLAAITVDVGIVASIIWVGHVAHAPVPH